jgi:hypothetical protein
LELEYLDDGYNFGDENSELLAVPAVVLVPVVDEFLLAPCSPF